MQAGTSGTEPPITSPRLDPPTPQVGGRLLVALATYNEHDNLEPLIKDILEIIPTADILVIDDNSPDGTGQLADQLVARDTRIHVIHREGKLGLGTALMAALRFAMEHDYDFIQIMDADFSHPPRYLPGILAGMSQYDVMIGSRYVEGGNTVGWPWTRLLISKTVNRMVRLLMRMPVRDASGAYRCYRISKMREVHLDKIRSRGYSFQQEVLFRCHLAGATMGEYPIIFENRRAGTSKVNLGEAIRSMSMLVFLGLRNIIGLEKRTKPKLPTTK